MTPVKLEPRGPSVSSQAFYHEATALPLLVKYPILSRYIFAAMLCYIRNMAFVKTKILQMLYPSIFDTIKCCKGMPQIAWFKLKIFPKMWDLNSCTIVVIFILKLIVYKLVLTILYSKPLIRLYIEWQHLSHLAFVGVIELKTVDLAFYYMSVIYYKT